MKKAKKIDKDELRAEYKRWTFPRAWYGAGMPSVFVNHQTLLYLNPKSHELFQIKKLSIVLYYR